MLPCSTLLFSQLINLVSFKVNWKLTSELHLKDIKHLLCNVITNDLLSILYLASNKAIFLINYILHTHVSCWIRWLTFGQKGPNNFLRNSFVVISLPLLPPLCFHMCLHFWWCNFHSLKLKTFQCLSLLYWLYCFLWYNSTVVFFLLRKRLCFFELPWLCSGRALPIKHLEIEKRIGAEWREEILSLCLSLSAAGKGGLDLAWKETKGSIHSCVCVCLEVYMCLCVFVCQHCPEIRAARFRGD